MAITDFQLAAYFVPSITVYNRLEATPRTADFDRSLKAEIRDPMWMLTRQWQFGEFKGEDAATAVTTKILGKHTTMNTVHFPNDISVAYDGKTPLETVVEKETVKPTLALAIQMARYFMRLIKTSSQFADLLGQLITKFRLEYELHPNDDEAHRLLDAVSGKVFDGFAFYKALDSGNIPDDIKNNHQDEINAFKSWFLRSYDQPAADATTAWLPSQLEYQFSVSASANEATITKLSADHYYGGHLDWYSFDLMQQTSSSSLTTDLVQEHIQSYIPTPLTFRGMPHPRFWMMEESVTDFGKINTTPTGLLHLLLAEFGLTCSNDWFMLPYQLAINTVCDIKGILVKDVFGEYTIVHPAGKGPDDQWQRWAMFHHNNLSGDQSSHTNTFYLVPAVNKTIEAPRLEQVNFLRDEMANMVWGVENIVPSQTGAGISGNEMAVDRFPKEETTTVGEPDPNKPTIRYILGTTVPSNWIPFIPVHVEGDIAEIRLQRARFPQGKKPRGVLLSEKKPPYYVDENILGSAGLLVSRSFQFTRFINGSNFLWLGRKKEAGKGEGWSNLSFDQIENVP